MPLTLPVRLKAVADILLPPTRRCCEKRDQFWGLMSSTQSTLSETWRVAMKKAINSENALRLEGMKLLIEGLGAVNAERFIHCVKADKFDYTEWQQDLWEGKTIDEIHQEAAASYNERHG